MRDPRAEKHKPGHVLPDGTSVGVPRRWWQRRRDPNTVYRLEVTPADITPKHPLYSATKREAKRCRRDIIEMARSVGITARVRITPCSADELYGNPPA